MISCSYEKSFPFPFVITATRDGICTVDFRKQLKRTKTTHWRYVQLQEKKPQGLEATHHHQRHIVLFFFWRLLGFWGGFLDRGVWLAVLCFSFLQGVFKK
jgi:hypothetical protein